MGNKFMNLGDKVKDTVTGYSGVIIARTEWLNGCWRMLVQPPVDKDGDIPDAHAIDEQQLELVEEKVAEEGSHETGGPGDVPTLPAQPKAW